MVVATGAFDVVLGWTERIPRASYQEVSYRDL